VFTPVLNITMPVFNRRESTLKSLLALHKCSRAVPFSVTVVDNGSDAALVGRLVDMKEAGIIDKLFLLEKNMGISCAANIGWEMTDAPYYMKLDNDMVVNDKDFFPRIFALWAHGEPLSTLGEGTPEQLLKNSGALHTKDGILGVCANTLSGNAMFIPGGVSDILGMWSEDYGLYGAEDGDYGLRMHCAGFPQYYYRLEGSLTDLGGNTGAEYRSRGLDKGVEYRAVLEDNREGYGLFLINQALYNLCIRTWKPVRKYRVVDVSSDYRVRLEENDAFAEYKRLLDLCASRINTQVSRNNFPNPDYIFSLDFIEELKGIMKSGGYDCAGGVS
jgi:glycosyltransferase involved in cell wall biosynthesis